MTALTPNSTDPLSGQVAKDYELKVTVQNVMNRRELVTSRQPTSPPTPSAHYPMDPWNYLFIGP